MLSNGPKWHTIGGIRRNHLTCTTRCAAFLCAGKVHPVTRQSNRVGSDDGGVGGVMLVLVLTAVIVLVR